MARHTASQAVVLGIGEHFTFGAVGGAAEVIMMPIDVPGPATVDLAGTLDGLNWVDIVGLQGVAVVAGEAVPIPYAGCYAVLKATMAGGPATIQFSSRWYD